MRLRFRHYIEENTLFEPGNRILLAVSGGVDSMVMLNLFNECGFDFAVAHCNFELRGNESDGDEKLVREITANCGKELFVKHFKTKDYAEEKSISIQVAARDLRYSWFDELCRDHGYKAVAVAHNSNDVAETMLINLTRGTGLKGLTGIKPKTNGIIRPLLFASRIEIELYAKEKGIIYRNDSSNTEIKYVRNRIRHQVIPELAQINPAVVSNFNSTANLLSHAWEVICEELNFFRKKVRTQMTNNIQYSIELLVNYPHRLLFLGEELMGYGFASEAIADIAKSLFSQPGKVFHSPNFLLIRDRDYLILTPKNSTELFSITIDENTKNIDSPIQLKIENIINSASFKIPKNPVVGAFDFNNLTFPLTLRPWHHGDWFIPLGMKGKKKISDFLVDQKVPIHLKEKIYVLESNNLIVWVVGHRIDDRFKITANTKKVWIGRIEKND